MVLSRSRQKFIYLQTSPFTSKSAIYAHELAFPFFQGMPREVIYDQDRVFLKDENLGDLIFTEEFGTYITNQPFEAVFCRKADPESKGKVENVVKYVKSNFIKGRLFISQESLNCEVLAAWLDRTGNARIHGTTHLIPKEEWEKEIPYLLPYQGIPIKPKIEILNLYKLRKDNTVAYRGNFNTVPLGTYRNQTTHWIWQDL